MNNSLIVITGFMGSGKSTVARALAAKLNMPMIDLDAEIQKQGRSAKQIIEEDGEPAFREIETRVLGGVLHSNSSGVIALGGGAWHQSRNRELIVSAAAISVWLDAPFDLCWQRIIEGDEARPLARNEQEALNRYTERRSSYASADLHVAAPADKASDTLAFEIAEALLLRKKNTIHEITRNNTK